ncbi:hypothetical protein GNI_076730 [Gregarina niphandrodes]|uniref:Uncharacterized protein n=1 Tax=Gregarina niphandrodes TaxID=110365 RepID=A0A023B6Q6_GRENI|nr:hypothetical protein GNI_076730 [Gregarina niphandrodes]EZG66736.1 hypothetical protein GNI_076730 [Gregarina niphandrodes]|eukprot:XP_011130508.1 hypothetical protein GNI_076730 [Gregarina niphandrodes]
MGDSKEVLSFSGSAKINGYGFPSDTSKCVGGDPRRWAQLPDLDGIMSKPSETPLTESVVAEFTGLDPISRDLLSCYLDRNTNVSVYFQNGWQKCLNPAYEPGVTIQLLPEGHQMQQKGLPPMTDFPVSTQLSEPSSEIKRPYFRSGAIRRDCFLYFYLPVDCPCGLACQNWFCPFAHSSLEKMFHPLIYRTEPCRRGVKCCRRQCSFLHSIEDDIEATNLWTIWEQHWQGYRDTSPCSCVQPAVTTSLQAAPLPEVVTGPPGGGMPPAVALSGGSKGKKEIPGLLSQNANAVTPADFSAAPNAWEGELPQFCPVHMCHPQEVILDYVQQIVQNPREAIRLRSSISTVTSIRINRATPKEKARLKEIFAKTGPYTGFEQYCYSQVLNPLLNHPYFAKLPRLACDEILRLETKWNAQLHLDDEDPPLDATAHHRIAGPGTGEPPQITEQENSELRKKLAELVRLKLGVYEKRQLLKQYWMDIINSCRETRMNTPEMMNKIALKQAFPRYSLSKSQEAISTSVLNARDDPEGDLIGMQIGTTGQLGGQPSSGQRNGSYLRQQMSIVSGSLQPIDSSRSGFGAALSGPGFVGGVIVNGALVPPPPPPPPPPPTTAPKEAALSAVTSVTAHAKAPELSRPIIGTGQLEGRTPLLPFHDAPVSPLYDTANVPAPFHQRGDSLGSTQRYAPHMRYGMNMGTNTGTNVGMNLGMNMGMNMDLKRVASAASRPPHQDFWSASVEEFKRRSTQKLLSAESVGLAPGYRLRSQELVNHYRIASGEDLDLRPPPPQTDNRNAPRVRSDHAVTYEDLV